LPHSSSPKHVRQFRRRSAVQNLVETAGFIEYAEARGYARDVSRAAEAIDALIEGGAAEDAIYLARDALDWVTEAYGSADDSSGSIGTAAHDLLAVHLRACQAAPPDPVDLGEYLADVIIADNYDLAPDPQDYAGLLGDAGTGPQAARTTSWNCAARSSRLNVPSPATGHCGRPPRTREPG
jgi:hypothetical protein